MALKVVFLSKQPLKKSSAEHIFNRYFQFGGSSGRPLEVQNVFYSTKSSRAVNPQLGCNLFMNGTTPLLNHYFLPTMEIYSLLLRFAIEASSLNGVPDII